MSFSQSNIRNCRKQSSQPDTKSTAYGSSHIHTIKLRSEMNKSNFTRKGVSIDSNAPSSNMLHI